MKNIETIKFFSGEDGQPVPIPVRTQQLWIILTSIVITRSYIKNFHLNTYYTRGMLEHITYVDLALLVGMKPRAAVTLVKHLGLIGHYCKRNNLPCLNALVVNQESLKPGDFVITTDGDYRKEQKNILEFDWHNVRPPSAAAFRKLISELKAEEGH